MWKKLQVHALFTVPVQLYLTSDEEIKEGDWYLKWTLGEPSTVFQHTGLISDKHYIKEGRKIVATDNSDLWGNPEGRCGGGLEMLGGDGEDGEGKEYPFYMKCEKCGETGFYNEKSAQKGCQIWSTKWIVKGIPKIPHSFIEYFAKEQGKVKEVLGEYWSDTYENGHPTGATLSYVNTPKLTPSGKIIWKPVEQKTYSRRDVVEKAWIGFVTAHSLQNKETVWDFPKFEKWFNKNYLE